MKRFPKEKYKEFMENVLKDLIKPKNKRSNNG